MENTCVHGDGAGTRLKWLGKALVTSTLFLYFLSQVSGLVRGMDGAHAKYKIARLNHTMPSFDHLRELIVQEGRLPRGDQLTFPQSGKDQWFIPYVRYYHLVAEYTIEKSAAYGMLGFLHYHRGDPAMAIEYYQKAAEMNPHFFWFHYNLGVLYYRAGSYQLAAEAFDHAIFSSWDLTQYFTLSRRVYKPFLDADDPQLTRRLTMGKYHAFALLVSCYREMGDFGRVVKISDYAITQLAPEFRGFFQYYAGVAAFRMKNFERAAAYLSRYLHDSPGNADARYYLGLSLKELGREDLAAMHVLSAKILNGREAGPPSVDDDVFVRVF